MDLHGKHSQPRNSSNWRMAAWDRIVLTYNASFDTRFPNFVCRSRRSRVSRQAPFTYGSSPPGLVRRPLTCSTYASRRSSPLPKCVKSQKNFPSSKSTWRKQATPSQSSVLLQRALPQRTFRRATSWTGIWRIYKVAMASRSTARIADGKTKCCMLFRGSAKFWRHTMELEWTYTKWNSHDNYSMRWNLKIEMLIIYSKTYERAGCSKTSSSKMQNEQCEAETFWDHRCLRSCVP